eukprot:scaffold105557_cov39-Tisochrysis_lutea.AAC.5
MGERDVSAAHLGLPSRPRRGSARRPRLHAVRIHLHHTPGGGTTASCPRLSVRRIRWQHCKDRWSLLEACVHGALPAKLRREGRQGRRERCGSAQR